MEEGDDGIDSDMGCVNRLYVRDEEVRHYQVVLDWLESNAAELIPELPTKVCSVVLLCQYCDSVLI